MENNLSKEGHFFHFITVLSVTLDINQIVCRKEHRMAGKLLGFAGVKLRSAHLQKQKDTLIIVRFL